MFGTIQRKLKTAISSEQNIPPLSVFCRYFSIGFIAFFLNTLGNYYYNFPVGEFILVGFIFFQLIQQRSILNLRPVHIGIFFATALAAWCGIMDFYHSHNVFNAIRAFGRLIIFFYIIFFYVYTPHKDAILKFNLGMVTACISYFVIGSTYYFIQAQPDEYYNLKYILPVPAFILIMLFFMQRNLGRFLSCYFLLFLIYAFISMPFIGSRGAFISILVALAAYGFYQLLKLPRGFFISIALVIPLTPLLIGLCFYNHHNPLGLTEWLFTHQLDTTSNIERTLLLNMSLKSIIDNPLTGIGADGNIAKLTEPFFVQLTELTRSTAESPHNYYLEVAVPYGLPALFFTLVCLLQIYRLVFTSTHKMGISAGIAVATICSISWVMLYEAVSSIERIFVINILIAVLSGFSSQFKSPEDTVT